MSHYDAAGIAADYARHRRVHPGVLSALLETGALGPASCVLEVGCGTGNYLRALVASSGCQAVGVDPSSHMLEQSRTQGGGIRYQVGDAEALAIDGPFDLIYSVDVIHHVGNPAAFFQRAHGLLRPGEQLCTATDSAEIIGAREPLSTYFPETVEADLARYPSLDTLRQLLAGAGFQDMQERVVAFACTLTDTCPYRDKAFSCLHLIPEGAFQRGLARLEADLSRGPVRAVARYALLWAKR